MTKALNDMLAPIRAEYLASEAWQKTAELGYPPEKKPEVKKKVKKEIDPAKRAAALAAREAAQAQKQEGGASVEEGVEKLKVAE